MTHQSVPTLEVVQLPMNWENASEAAIQFALRYKQYKINRGRKCKICIDEGETDEESKCELVCYGYFAPFHELICPSKMGWPLGMHKSKLQSDSCRRMYCETCYKANVFFCAWCGHHPWNGGDKRFCNECSPLTKCEECGYLLCTPDAVTVLVMDAHICTSSNVQTALELGVTHVSTMSIVRIYGI